MNLQSVSKAVAGAIVAALVTLLAKHNVILGADVSQAIAVLLAAIIGFAGVWVAPKNKP